MDDHARASAIEADTAYDAVAQKEVKFLLDHFNKLYTMAAMIGPPGPEYQALIDESPIFIERLFRRVVPVQNPAQPTGLYPHCAPEKLMVKDLEAACVTPPPYPDRRTPGWGCPLPTVLKSSCRVRLRVLVCHSYS